MSDIIRLLPDSVANQIAAGEVIQRPASVVKELVENAVDAGADNIQIIIQDAGRTLIQVVDNGKGMSPMDARMAFERHATSKITEAADLFSLHTMGFRGEALASIAAVAQVELVSMRPDDTVGTRLVISGSKVETQEPASAVPGSNMMVKNLFFNVPARRKFLKKDSVEFSNIVHEFERLALVNPDVALTLIHNSNVVHQLMAGSLKQRIGNLFGKAVERQLIPLSAQTSIVNVSGFVGLPENARRKGALQYLFVNGRNMRHPYFHKAVMHCYEQLIRQDEQPNYFINFEVDPATIDVNIHPTKNEIKFENEQPIWQILVAAIKEALGKFNIVPSIDFDAQDMPDIPAFNPKAHLTNDFGPTEEYNPFAPENQSEEFSQLRASRLNAPSSGSTSWQRDSRRAVENWEQLYQSFTSDKEAQESVSQPFAEDEVLISSSLNSVKSLFQINDKYIVCRNGEGLMLINQHRAHLRVLFEQFSVICVGGKIPTQSVLFPEMVYLPKAQSNLLESHLALMENAGFDISNLGDGSWAINGVPAVESLGSPVELLLSIVDDLSQEVAGELESINRKIALRMARSGAMTAGRVLTDQEMEHLTNELFSLDTPLYTPDGLKVFVQLDTDAVDKLFEK